MYIGKMLCHLTFFSPVWVFYVLRLVASEVAYSQWLHWYDFSMLFDNMFPKMDMLNYLICQRYIHTDYTYEILPQKIFSLLCIPHATCSDKCYIWRRSLQGVFSYALLVCLHGKPNIHTCCIFVTSLVTPHNMCLRGGIITLAAFVRLHSMIMFTLNLKLRFEF